MNKQQLGLAFATLGVVSLAVAGSCLLFNEALGGLSYVGATLAVFLAMLCATRFSALRKAAPAAPRAPKPEQKRPKDPVRNRAVSAREDSEDEVIESRMAALHAAVEVEDAPSTLPPQLLEHNSFFAPAEHAPDASSVEVIEEPLDPAVAQQFAELRSEPATPEEEAQPSVGLRQMDDIRAQIARLREESRVRHAANMARSRMPSSEGAAPLAALVPEGSSQPGGATGNPDPFARTEFSGLPGATRASFARTEYLAPAELPR